MADASPVQYMVQLGLADLLRALYKTVLLPSAVAEELSHESTPATVRIWMEGVPDWVRIADPAPIVDPVLWQLDPGERSALQLALDKAATVVLMDERKGVRIARGLGLAVTGTLGTLRDAHEHGLIDARAEYRRLIVETNFRYTEKLSLHFLGLLRRS